MDNADEIKRLRRVLTVHSYLYYVLDTTLVSDEQWQAWANRLVDLQSEGAPKLGVYDEEFSDWDGATGYHLSRDDWVHSKSQQLLRYVDRMPVRPLDWDEVTGYHRKDGKWVRNTDQQVLRYVPYKLNKQ